MTPSTINTNKMGRGQRNKKCTHTPSHLNTSNTAEEPERMTEGSKGSSETLRREKTMDTGILKGTTKPESNWLLSK